MFRGGSGRGPKRIKTMRIDILTVVPELLVSPLNESILKRAQRAGLVEIVVHNIRDWATNTAMWTIIPSAGRPVW